MAKIFVDHGPDFLIGNAPRNYFPPHSYSFIPVLFSSFRIFCGNFWQPLQKLRFSNYKTHHPIGSIPKTHCDSPKRKSRIGTGDIGVISSTPTANGFAMITEEINVLLPRLQSQSHTPGILFWVKFHGCSLFLREKFSDISRTAIRPTVIHPPNTATFSFRTLRECHRNLNLILIDFALAAVQAQNQWG